MEGTKDREEKLARLREKKDDLTVLREIQELERNKENERV